MAHGPSTHKGGASAALKVVKTVVGTTFRMAVVTMVLSIFFFGVVDIGWSNIQVTFGGLGSLPSSWMSMVVATFGGDVLGVLKALLMNTLNVGNAWLCLVLFFGPIFFAGNITMGAWFVMLLSLAGIVLVLGPYVLLLVPVIVLVTVLGLMWKGFAYLWTLDEAKKAH